MMNFIKRKTFLFCTFICLILVFSVFASVCLIQQTTNGQDRNAAIDGLITQTASEQTVTTDLNFSLYINNGEQEYRVSALSKALREAIIPSHYNGLPVTEIADSGFMACSNLEYVFIPTTIQRVGNNAFMNDTKLKRVVGMPNVKVIGNNAFALCSSLEYLILPSGLSSLGQNVIRNTVNPVYARASAERMTLMNPNWNYNGNIIYGNEIVYRDYTNAQGVVGYEIAPYQIFEQDDLDLTIRNPLTIYSWCYKNKEDDIGAPLLNIAEGAFAMSTVPYITIKHPENSGLSHTINIESDAFSSVDSEYINIEVDISLNNNNGGESTGVFYGSNFQSITLPDSLNAIPDRMFGACENLTEIKNTNPSIATNQLSDKILIIGADAFNNTKKLPQLFVQNTIEYIGNSAFNLWGSTIDQLLSIDVIEEDASNWGMAWRTGIKEIGSPKCIVDFTGASSFALELIVNQTGVIEPTGNSTLQVSRNSTLNDIAISSPSSVSHNFTGVWYTTEDRIPGTEFEANEPIKRNLSLYAGWEIKSFEIEFPTNKYLDFKDINDNILTGDANSYHYGEVVTFFITLKDGYKNPAIGFDGGTLVPNTGNLYTITITGSANFTVGAELIEYTITYANLREGANPNTITTYTIESATINFVNPIWAAYSNGTWDITSIPSGSLGNKTITAIWSNPVSFTITYANLRNGTNPNTITTYTIESPTINLSSPEWEAYDGRTWDITSIPNGSWGDKIVTAVWTSPVPFTITYTNLRSGTNPNTTTFYTVESATINFASPEWEAYSGRTWDITSIPSGSWGNKTITAVWSNPVEFKISYLNLQSGTNPVANPMKYTIDTPTITFINPTWAAYSSGVWDTSRIATGSWGDKTITAIWSNPVVFKINYVNLQGGTHSNTVMSYRIDSNTINFSNPTWAAYYNGTWDTTSIPKGSWGDKTITAIWANPVPFTITYENLQGGTHANTMTGYTVESDTITFKNPTWAAYKNGTWETTTIPKGSWGNKVIIAKWSNAVKFTISYNGVKGGINPSTNPLEYTVETPTIVFANPLWAAYNNGRWDTATIPRGSWGDKTISAIWSNPIEFSITYQGLENGTNSSSNPTHYNVETETIYFTGATRLGYPNSSWDIASISKGSWGDKIISAVWSQPIIYYISYNNLQGGQNPNTRSTYTVEDNVTFANPTRAYYNGTWDITSIPKGSTGNKTITAKWTAHTYTITFYYQLRHIQSNDDVIAREFSVTVDWNAGYTITVPETNTAPGWDVQNFEQIIVKSSNNLFKPDLSSKYYSINGRTLTFYSTNSDLIGTNPHVLVYYSQTGCVAEGTMITLADGSQKPVEQLTTDDMLLVWNLKTGKFDTAPILFIDSDQRAKYEVINLNFSDGTSVKVISEHGFWDFDLNEYVFMRNDAAKYIGHWFNKQTTDVDGNMSWIKVRLNSVEITEEMTTSWSPVTYEHLCYYVNGMLSMPGATTGLINIFDVNPDTMKIDEVQYQADIEQYGLFTYEEFAAILPVPEEIFDAFGGKYFKVAMGKGILTWDMIQSLVQRYAKFF